MYHVGMYIVVELHMSAYFEVQGSHDIIDSHEMYRTTGSVLTRLA